MTSGPPSPLPSSDRAAAGSGKRILVVEDETMIRMLLADMLSELGYSVAGEAGRMNEALAAANTLDFDVAILDVNLSGESVKPVAAAVAARGLPFVFATGYGLADLPDGFRERPALRKPYHVAELQETIESALAGHAGLQQKPA